ncbi:hypothetical protein GCM10022377_07730 [Zhihengliuella alba]|uniref:Mechanosensitive ion channel n=1 Tax=Zhihengliuella alba TaxID=547018 RepID=A0ABP7CYB8_9MICC
MQDTGTWGNIDWPSMAMKVALAIVILLVTWIIAKAVKWAVAKLVTKIPALQKQGGDGRQVGESLGQIASLLVWLFGLMAILQLFALQQVLAPIQGLLNGVLGFLPNLIGAAVLFIIGYVLAKIVRQLIEAALGTVDLSKLTSKFKKRDEPVDPVESVEQNNKVAALVGNLVFGIIMIVVSIAALQVLGIEAISNPAQDMLNMFLNAIPAIIGAAILLAIGYVISKFLGKLLEDLLRGLGTDRSLRELGIVPEGTSGSTVITRIVQFAIMVFFAVMAARLLNFPEVTRMLEEILELGGAVLFGGVIIAAGFLIASIIGRFITNKAASGILRYATIALFIAMGLRYMGIADSIINLAFGAIVVGAALAAALAFGLGGREAAAKVLQKVDVQELGAKAEESTPKSGGSRTAPPTPPTPPASPSAGTDPTHRAGGPGSTPGSTPGQGGPVL